MSLECNSLRLPELRRRLRRSGHDVRDSESGTTDGINVFPRPGRIITVGLEADPTLYKQYRQRFFTSSTDAELLLERMACVGQFVSRWLEILARIGPEAGVYHDFL